MAINETYDEAAIVEAIATAPDNFYTNLINKVDSLNIRTVMKRNRLVKEFTQEFCLDDGGIDWEKLVKFNSGE